jgi:hypothetical protein
MVFVNLANLGKWKWLNGVSFKGMIESINCFFNAVFYTKSYPNSSHTRKVMRDFNI